MMKITRLAELSLFYKIRDVLSIKRTGEIAKSVDFSSYSLKYNNIPTAFDVVVYVDSVISTSGYVVDYINGLIKFGTHLTANSQVKVDYYFCPFNIYDEGSNEITDNFKYPAIAIYEHDAQAEPFELGNSNTEKIKSFIIEVWAENGGQRTDATDAIVEMLESNIAIINYNDGFPYNLDGAKNLDFNSNDILTFGIPDSINYTKGGSLDSGNKPKFYSEINFDLKIFI